MDKAVKRWERKSFSGEDIFKLCDSKVIIRRYRDLADVKSLKDALGTHKAMVVLYETRPAYGHWCAVLEVSPATTARPAVMEFFDPYGLAPDGQLDFIPKAFRGADPATSSARLSQLIEKSGCAVIYNNAPLQHFSRGMNTCGRWCGLRIAMRDIPLKKFIKLFERQTFSPDWYCTALTMFV